MDLTNKHIMAIDYGRKFTGIATYKYKNDPYPLGYGRIAYESDKQLISQLKTIIDDEFVDILIIGVPYFTDGTESTMTKTVKEFVALAKAELEIEVLEQDETLTTFEAEERMKSSPQYNFAVDPKKIDELSAVIILEEFVKQ